MQLVESLQPREFPSSNSGCKEITPGRVGADNIQQPMHIYFNTAAIQVWRWLFSTSCRNCSVVGSRSEYKVFTGWVRAVCLALILEPEGPMVFGDIPICQFQAGLPGQNVPPLIFKKFCLRVHYWDGLR
jgi:hypothetical protein